MSKKEKKVEINKNKYILIVSIVVIALLALLFFINIIAKDKTKRINKLEDIRKIKRVLSTRYNDISCVDIECEYVVGTTGDSLKKTTYNVFNINGKKVATYKIDYGKKSSKSTDIVAATNNYIITKIIDNKKNSYTLRNTKGKAKYSSNDIIKVVNNNLAAVKDDENYNLVNKNGRIIIDDVNFYEVYNDGKFINIEKKNEKYIVGENGDELLQNYYISEEIKNKNLETEFLIVKNQKSSEYNYFDIVKNKIVGDSFDNYNYNEQGDVIVSKTINKSLKKYLLKSDGKQVSYRDSEDNIYDKIVKKIDSDKFYIYRYGITNANQKFVVANQKQDKSLGILNIKNNKFTKLFKYSKSTPTLGAVVSSIKSNDGSIIRITCSEQYCGTAQNLIYNLTSNKIVYKETKKDVIISDFAMYDDNYKIIKYSYDSNNNEYAGNSFVYNRNNKIINSSNYSMAIIDKNIKIGTIKNSDLILYSVKQKRKVNKANALATKIVINENEFFKYNDKSKIIVYKLNNDKVLEVSDSSYITYTNDYIVYLVNNRLNIYNTTNNKTKSYKLKNNEKINDEFGEIVNPYRGIIVVNNSVSKNVKVVSSKGKVIKKIKKVELSSVRKNTDGRLLIIVKSNYKSKDVYGLYVGN